MKKIVFFLTIICIYSTNNSICYSQHMYGINIPYSFDIEEEFDISNFTTISDNANLSKYHFIDSIIPDKYYYYWECIFADFDNYQVYVYNGDSLHFAEKTKKIKSNTGFFYECHPGICYHYIIAIDSSKNVVLMNSDKKFRNFIGKIDNLSEALLIARLHELYISNKEKIGGAYKEEESYYLLYLTEWEWCPYRAYSVRAILHKTGEFIVVDKKMYEEDLEYCIIE